VRRSSSLFRGVFIVVSQSFQSGVGGLAMALQMRRFHIAPALAAVVVRLFNYLRLASHPRQAGGYVSGQMDKSRYRSNVEVDMKTAFSAKYQGLNV